MDEMEGYQHPRSQSLVAIDPSTFVLFCDMNGDRMELLMSIHTGKMHGARRPTPKRTTST